MKISDIDKSVKIMDLENFFEVYEDSRDSRAPYMFNLNSTVYFDGVPKQTYKPSHDMFWTIISYELYGTTRLWWVLMKVNDVGIDSAFEPVRAGQTIKYIDKSAVRNMLLTLGD